jgi:hypothetical protein
VTTTFTITHAQAERRLLDMPIGSPAWAWGRRVLRLDATTWVVAGGPALGLLAALDAVLGPADDDGVRFPLAYRLPGVRQAEP